MKASDVTETLELALEASGCDDVAAASSSVRVWMVRARSAADTSPTTSPASITSRYGVGARPAPVRSRRNNFV